MQFVFHCITADLTGTAKTGADEKEAKLDAAFHATLHTFSLREEHAELMDARRAAFRDRIPAELDIVGIEIPAGSRGWLLQDSIAACVVQK
jgi:hypothetical protein